MNKKVKDFWNKHKNTILAVVGAGTVFAAGWGNGISGDIDHQWDAAGQMPEDTSGCFWTA